MRSRADPFARPLDRALERLRAHGLPYCGDATHFHTWHAVCPHCRVPAWTLTLREYGHGGKIGLRCAGCESADVAAALEADPAARRIEAAQAREAEAWALVAELRVLAARALELAAASHAQLRTPERRSSGLEVAA